MIPWSRRWFLATLAIVFELGVSGGPAALRAADAPAYARPWGGIFPTVVTPFRGPLQGIDVAALNRQLDFLIRGGVHGLVVCDSYGEGEFLTPHERGEIIRTSVAHAGMRLPVVVGIQTCDVTEARRQTAEAAQFGASAVLVTYLGRPHADVEQVSRFMRDVCQGPILPVFYDHCPARSQVDLTPAELAHVVTLPGIDGIRAGHVSAADVGELLRLCEGTRRVVFTATALNLTQFLKAGGCGAMCPESVLLPGPTVKAYAAFVAGRPEEARAIQDEMFALTPILHLRPSVPILERVAYLAGQEHKLPLGLAQDAPQAQIKAALTCMGVATPVWVKKPLPALTAWDQRCVTSTMKSIVKIDWFEVALSVPPEPLTPQAGSQAGGMLLKTGAFQLGAGVSKDLLHSQNDGYSGFFP